jgi:hypothetical protein
MWHSPFQPDAASDWANFVVGLLTAIATLVAVGLSVQSSRRSREDALQARADTAKAQARTAAAEERAVKAAEEQAAASALISATERELERDRHAYQRQLETEQKASRQAVLVRLTAQWNERSDGGAPDAVAVHVNNLSSDRLSEVTVEWLRPGADSGWDLGVRRVAALAAHRPALGLDLGAGHVTLRFDPPEDEPPGSPLSFRMRFTDRYLDEWELHHPSRELVLLTPRVISVKEPPASGSASVGTD